MWRSNRKMPADWMEPIFGTHTEGAEITNLNLAKITNADGPDVPLSDQRGQGYECLSGGIAVQVVFQNLEDRLIEHIDAADGVLGCMAWLTNRRILEALARKKFVSILVQKEDWLRPDGAGWSVDRLLRLYSKLPAIGRFDLDIPYSYCTDFDVPPIMCVGNCPLEKSPAMARMHHKFLVMCHFQGPHDIVTPTSVWTGSFNATENGTKSLENAVVITNAEIASEYHREWLGLFGLAEPLNWDHRWVTPEFRIGT